MGGFHDSPWDYWALILGTMLLTCLLIGTICMFNRDFCYCYVPPGVCQPLKVRFFHFILLMLFSSDYILWKLGLFKWLTFVNWMFDGIPPADDPSLSIKDKYFEGAFVRLYQPKEPAVAQRKGILFFHGGGGVMGSVKAYERMCRYIAKESESVLVSVGYRLAPESRYPSQFIECLDATVHFLKHAVDYGVDPASIIICGDSFGGTLAAYICQELKGRTDLPKVRAQMLLYPFLQCLDITLPSYQQNRFFPLMSLKDLSRFASYYMGKPTSVIDMAIAGSLIPEDIQDKYKKWVSTDHIPYKFRIRNPNPAPPRVPEDNLFNLIQEVLDRKLSPLLADDSFIKDLPETFILTCEYDIQRDDGLLYKKRLEDNGVQVSWYHLEDGFHAVPVLVNHWFITFPCAKTGVDSVVNFIRGL